MMGLFTSSLFSCDSKRQRKQKKYYSFGMATHTQANVTSMMTIRKTSFITLIGS
jgi:hypothetical protein